ncbi:MAG: hypothetical protein U0904_07760 [Candidatus Nanopelagicales bacterium]|nr:hypothetical protein [Candidatus Nanopelagicales bacterium]
MSEPSTAASPGRPNRPFSVTLVTFLIGLAGVLQIVVGVLALFAASDTRAVLEEGLTPDALRVVALVGILYGLVLLLVASLLSRGSNAMRIIVTLLLILRIVLAPFVVTSTGRLSGEIVGVIFIVIALALLWNSKASAFFKPRS